MNPQISPIFAEGMSEEDTVTASLVETVIESGRIQFTTNNPDGSVGARVSLDGEEILAVGKTIGDATFNLRIRLRCYFGRAVRTLKSGGLDVVSLLTKGER